MTIPYIYIPILAVCCYVFLLFAFLAAKKNRVIRTFMVMLVGFILWTGGSMLMRLQVFPGYRFWYEVSLLSMFSIATIFYCFIHSFYRSKGHVSAQSLDRPYRADSAGYAFRAFPGSSAACAHAGRVRCVFV